MPKRISLSRSRPSFGVLWRNLLGLIVLSQASCSSLMTPDIPVPVLIGATQEQAQNTLEALGLSAQIRPVDTPTMERLYGSDRDAWPPPDSVIEQAPANGALPAGAVVILHVARYKPWRPPPMVPVEIPGGRIPDVRTLSMDAAVNELLDAGFRVRTQQVNAQALRARFGAQKGLWPLPDAVFDQSPAGGQIVAITEIVDVQVARWTPGDLGDMALVGSTRDRARRQLEAAGYRVQVVERAPLNAPNAKRGEVLAAQLTGREDGRNVLQLTVAGADGRNLTPPLRDSDGDGVPDRDDQCARTPPGVSVDVAGCRQPPPLDSDNDGIVDAADACPGTASGVVVDARGCARSTSITDADGDGVPDDQDLCPDSPAGSFGAAQGCTLTQRVNRLPEGLYAFNRQTVMQVGRPEPYKIVLVLDPRGSATLSEVEAQVISELPAGDRPPSRDVRPLSDTTGDCAAPVVCFREKYYERMRVTLRVDQDDWVIRPDNPVDIRGVVNDQVTRWSWTVTPACDGGGLLDGQCRPAALTLDAYAMFDDTSYGPIMVFNEQITVEVSAEERVASFFERYRTLILGAMIFAAMLGLAAWWLSRRRPGPVQPRSEYEAVSVLFIGANPRGTSRIRLDEEVRGIDQSIRLGERRDAFKLHQHWAARVSDLDDALMRFKPNIVHISAHGTDRGELLLEGGEGDDGKVSAAQLEKLFAILSDDIRLVVLNACFSQEQARLIVNHVDCVVGMSDAVNDKVAQRFAESFYLALANGRNVQIAFELASAEVQGKSGEAVPRLLALRSDPRRVEFARRAPTRHIEGVNT